MCVTKLGCKEVYTIRCMERKKSLQDKHREPSNDKGMYREEDVIKRSVVYIPRIFACDV